MSSWLRYFYTAVFYLALPFLLLRLWRRSKLFPDYRQRWHERLGQIQLHDPRPVLWIHAVSVGETIAATPLARQLLQQYPAYQIIITTMTATGAAQVKRSLNDQVTHFYLPYDLPIFMRRFLNRLQPKIGIIMETELWPNLLHISAEQKIPIILANARLSARSARGYRWLNGLMRTMLNNLYLILTQTDADAKRYLALGASKNKIVTVGNIKFDIDPPSGIQTQALQLRSHINATERPVWIAASTHAGEEEIILTAFSKIRTEVPNALLILVPRHPERFDSVAALSTQRFKTCRRSSGLFTNDCVVYLGDSMGELWLYYAMADVAFVGGSLVAVGGHNLLEPAALELPIITGNHLFNFAVISDLLRQADALITVDNSEQLNAAVIRLFKDSKLRQYYGNNAQQVVMQQRGALQQHLKYIQPLLN